MGVLAGGLTEIHEHLGVWGVFAEAEGVSTCISVGYMSWVCACEYAGSAYQLVFKHPLARNWGIIAILSARLARAIPGLEPPFLVHPFACS